MNDLPLERGSPITQSQGAVFNFCESTVEIDPVEAVGKLYNGPLYESCDLNMRLESSKYHCSLYVREYQAVAQLFLHDPCLLQGICSQVRQSQS